MSSLEAVDSDTKIDIKEESFQKSDGQIIITSESTNTEPDKKDFLSKVRHLELEYEILKNLVNKQEESLHALEKEGAKLRELLGNGEALSQI